MGRAKRRIKGIDVREFWNFWLKVIEENMAGAVIVAEGRKDERALRKLLIQGEIVTSQQHSVSWVVRQVAIRGNRAMIFTDFDVKGEKIARVLRKSLLESRIEVLDHYREEFRRVLGGGIKEIEDLIYIADELLEEAPMSIAFKKLLLPELKDVIV